MQEIPTIDPRSPASTNLYWTSLAVFAALLLANAAQCVSHFQQRRALLQARTNADTLAAQAKLIQSQIEPRLEAFSLELLQVANTNETAREIVRQFNIKWTPQAQAPATASPRGTTPIPDLP